MGANKLPYFRYAPQYQQDNLLGCWRVPSTISATIAFQNSLEQFYMAEYLSKCFAVWITIWYVLGSAYSTLINEYMHGNWHVLLLVPPQGNLPLTANNNFWYFCPDHYPHVTYKECL